MSIPAPVYVDGTLTTAARVSMPVFSCPIPGVATAYLLTEDWQMLVTDSNAWAPTAIGTPHAENADYILVGESEPRDVGGGMVRWTRTYAKVPATHYEPERVAYHFIGFWGVWGNQDDTIVGRERYSRVVTALVTYEYATADSPTGYLPTEPTRYWASTATIGTLETDYLVDGDTAASATLTGTVPTRTTYEGWVSGGGYDLVVESTVDRWRGNIFRRRTVRVKAE